MRIQISGLLWVLWLSLRFDATAQIVLYNNWAPDSGTLAYPTDNSVPSGGTVADEIGDEIVLAANTPRTVNAFQLQYFAQGLSGDEQVVVHFYPNTGPVDGQGFATPNSTPIFTSTPLALSVQNGRGVLNLENLNVTVPDSFTWAVQFSGVTGSEVAGLVINGPPTIGTSYNDYWEKASGTWARYQFTNPPQPGSFGAEITAVPEPAVTAVTYGVGALALVLFLRTDCVKRKSSPRPRA